MHQIIGNRWVLLVLDNGSRQLDVHHIMVCTYHNLSISMLIRIIGHSLWQPLDEEIYAFFREIMELFERNIDRKYVTGKISPLLSLTQH